jgi:tetratricopeptide (TPR) repeat protein
MSADALNMSRALVGCFALVGIALFATASAHAQTLTRFERRVALAQQLYRAQDYEGAIRELEAAYRLSPAPRLLFNLGMAHRKLGHPRQALDYFERYRSARASIDIKVPVDQYIDELRAQLADEQRPITEKDQDPDSANSKARPSTSEGAEPSAAPPDLTIVPAPARARPTLVAPPSTQLPPRPVYRKWWFWTATLGGAAVAATAIA